jgi:Leucine-rich repeat (LRR) protein
MQQAENDISIRSTMRIHSHAIGIRRLLLLCILLCASLGLAFWLQPAQAAPSAHNGLLPFVPSITGLLKPGAQSPISSPLVSGTPDPLAFTPLNELRPEITNFVAALGQLRADQLSSSLSDSSLSSLPLSDFQVGPPPVFTQPNRNPSSQLPALIGGYSVYLPLIQTSPAPLPASPAQASPPPAPPFSCKNFSTVNKRIQCQALVAFYASTQGDYWLKNDGWLRASDPCRWYGVTCDREEKVIGLTLNGNGLFGRIPDEIGLLPLESLQVSNNALVGTLPEAITGLTSLRDVDIRQNQLRGSYPLRFLQLLNTSRSQSEQLAQFQTNGFTRIDTGSFRCTSATPEQLMECEALVALFRSTDGENPNSYYWSAGPDRWLLQSDPCQWSGVSCQNNRITGLSFGNLGNRKLTGRLPSDIGSLAMLTRLEIESGELTGPLPAEIGFLYNLKTLTIRNSHLSGGVPPELGSLVNLEELDLAGNQLAGSIPATLGKLKVIRRIDLSRNFLSGPIPDELALVNLGTNTEFQTLALSGNPNLCVPSTLGRLSNIPLFIPPAGGNCHPTAR